MALGSETQAFIDERKRAALYRERAAELRQLAESVTNDAPRRELLSLADTWDAMAARLETHMPLTLLASILNKTPLDWDR